ncbi:MAG TPA: hypothetical protein VMT91_00105 [Anaerolineales bacterium]|nr:hypothetical protein [Anaerolineales bacterium]
MAALSPDEKSTLVMTYTQNMLVRGEVINRQGVRVSTWLRTQGVPEYIHLFKATVLRFGSGGVKALTYAEVFVPVTTVIAFHLVPPVSEGLDYDSGETNRVMVPVIAMPGTFQFKGFIRISGKATFSNSIELAHSDWSSIYDVDVTNPSMPQMQPIHVPMILINPKQVSLAVE